LETKLIVTISVTIERPCHRFPKRKQERAGTFRSHSLRGAGHSLKYTVGMIGRAEVARLSATRVFVDWRRRNADTNVGYMSSVRSLRKKSSDVIRRWVALAPALVFGQGRGGSAATATPKAATPTDADFTGYWVSIVTEAWRRRMLPPARGDYASIPLNLAGKETADTWDPAKDEASGEQCRSYGAPAIMHVPERLHIAWQDDNTLKVETDAGEQTRLFHFGAWKIPASPPGWQGDSCANWEIGGPARGGGRGGPPKNGSMKIVTTHIRPGYLRKNGVPYSADAELTEHWNIVREPNNTQWLAVTEMLHDPKYLQDDWITDLNFRRESDGSTWAPKPCSSRW